MPPPSQREAFRLAVALRLPHRGSWRGEAVTEGVKQRLTFLHENKNTTKKHLEKLQDAWWLRGPDLNQRPSGYEPDELPDCSTPRYLLVRVSHSLTAQV